VMTVGMQVEMVMVLKTGAGEEAGATEVYGAAGAELEAAMTTPAGELVGTGGATTLELATTPAGELVGYLGGEVSVAVTGQTVVYKSTTTVVVWGPAGQLVTVGAHEVTVITLVSRTVEVVYPVWAVTAATAPKRVMIEAFILTVGGGLRLEVVVGSCWKIIRII